MPTQTTEPKKNTQTQTAPFDTFNQAMDCFRNAVDAGAKFQQDAFKMMTDGFNFGGFNFGKGDENVQDKFENVARQTVDTVRRNSETSQKLFDETSRTGLDLLHKCFENFTPNGDADHDLIHNTRTFWENTFDAVKTNSETMAQANVSMVENVSNLITKSAQVCTPKTCKN